MLRSFIPEPLLEKGQEHFDTVWLAAFGVVLTLECH